MTKQHTYTVIAWRPFMNGNGSVEYVHLEADLNDLLNWLGGKAKASKRGHSQIGHGAIRARIRKTKP